MIDDRPPPLRVLLIEDNPGDARLIREMLDEPGGPQAELDWAKRLADGLDRLAQDQYDAVLLDLSLPDSIGMTTFSRALAAAGGVPIVVLSGLADEATALATVQHGAQDYLVKGQVDGSVLKRSLRYSVERKRLEDERAELLARERAAQVELARQKDEFFANVSHDLRTPLFAIKVSIGVVLANEPNNVPEPLHRLFVNIDAAADQMTRLVDDLLELTRLQAGRVRLRPERFSLVPLVRKVVAGFEAVIADAEQSIRVEASSETISIVADPARLERTLSNLIGNASKYSSKQSVIVVSVHQTGDSVLISVADNGPGIPLSEHERIFERYYRSETADVRRKQGSGLGLPIARRMVELHGGRLWVESTPGQGSTFWITLPAGDPVGQDQLTGSEPDEDTGR